MADATLTIICTLHNGADTRAIELHALHRAAQLALQRIRAEGGTVTSYTATAESGATAAAVYSPVASR